MRKLQITEGEAYHEFNSVSEFSINGHYTVKIGDVGVPFCVIPMPIGGIDTKQKALDKCQLVTDAITTANKCDMLPSELLEQRDKLLKLLKDVYLKNQQLSNANVSFAVHTDNERAMMRNLISKCSNVDALDLQIEIETSVIEHKIEL